MTKTSPNGQDLREGGRPAVLEHSRCPRSSLGTFQDPESQATLTVSSGMSLV